MKLLHRWQRKAKYHMVANQDGVIYQWPDGTLRSGSVFTMDPETIDRIREGRRCIQCGEDQEAMSFPEACSLCGFPMKDKQSEQFERDFLGESKVGTAIKTLHLDVQARKREEEGGYWSADGLFIPTDQSRFGDLTGTPIELDRQIEDAGQVTPELRRQWEESALRNQRRRGRA